MYYVYVIQSKEKGIYIGYTNNLKRRFYEHNNDKSTHTKNATWRLVYYESFADKQYAITREKALKHHGQAKRRLMERIKNSLSGTS